jgi:AGCS family alanine or glycine:cation symporter
MFNLFTFLSKVDAFFWSYVGFSLILLLGCYFTIKTRFFQIRAIPSVVGSFFGFLRNKDLSTKGVHPLKAFFASVGGTVGVGNVVGIITALQLGGPGAIFWAWIAAFLGSLIKYSEIFLGLKYRKPNRWGGYDGGSIYFLQKAFGIRWIGTVISILLCIYGAEVYQFSVLSHTLAVNWNLNKLFVSVCLLGAIGYAIVGGIHRVGKICALLMPAFIMIYVGMSLWVIGHHVGELPFLLKEIFRSAFSGHAAVGGFAGSSIILALQHGTARSIYSADIGIGYDSIIQSETKAQEITKQARLAILGVFIDASICTLTLFVALTSGLWKASPSIDPSLVIQTAFSAYIPYQSVFMTLLLFVLVYTTLVSYLFVGLKCARYLHDKHGEKIYLCLAALFLLTFSFFDQSKALLVMSLSGCLLMSINLLGIFRLRHEIPFEALSASKRSAQKTSI